MTAPLRTGFDAVIVGAGPAGSAAAILLARAGWALALVERQPFPRRKVCGDIVAAAHLPLLRVLGVGDAFQQHAGPELHRATLWIGQAAIQAEWPPAGLPSGEGGVSWGRALGRDTLDGLLLDQARAAGATVFQPWSVQSLAGKPGAWQCELRAPQVPDALLLRAALVIDAHGGWEHLPSPGARRRIARQGADLYGFKACFRQASLPAGAITLLALEGGYGSMVLADDGSVTLSCCLRRDRLDAVRATAPALRAGDALEAWLRRECAGVRRALRGAERDGTWLMSGPLDPGVHLHAEDGIFRIGNAAGEAHPILGEGIGMALQSAALLGTVLLGRPGAVAVPPAKVQAQLQRRYVAAWRLALMPRLRLAATFAHLAMRPRLATAAMKLLQLWPGPFRRGARWGGKVQRAPTLDAPRKNA